MLTFNVSRKIFVFVLVIALLFCFAQTVVFAANTVNVKDGVYSNGIITVTGAITTKGAEMTMLAIRTNNPEVQLSDYATPEDLAEAVQYIDQVTADSDNFEKTWTFTLRDGGTGDYVVVFVSGTDTNVARLAIPLVSYDGTNGTVTFENGSDFVDNAPVFVVAGGDDDWAGQLEAAVTDGYGDAVDAYVDIAAGTVTMEALFEKTTYTLTIENTSDDYPPFTATKVFTLISEEGAAAAVAIEELNVLPANLGIKVDRGDDAYIFTIPEDTENITYTVTVDGEVVAERPLVVNKAVDEDRTVVVTAVANGTDETKTYQARIPGKGADAPEITEDDVNIITASGGVYKRHLGAGNVIVTIAAGDIIDPSVETVTVGGVEFYYVAKCNYFVGVVSEYADKAAVLEDIDIADGASDVIEYGKDPINGELGERIDNGDYIAVKKIALGKVNAPTDKQLLSADVADGVMDGLID
ncbi:MAG: hypothetical protein J5590_03760, partial [Clostridia bacterium]|nr:hypothetical protein [Clostridia bacterium]